jgi:hypothetical protein
MENIILKLKVSRCYANAARGINFEFKSMKIYLNLNNFLFILIFIANYISLT